MTFKPTAEQEAIIAAGTETNDNILVTALAGAAKTSTLVLLAEALAKTKPNQEILCLAFNKKTALEMADRLPDTCKARTLNSLGYTTWAASLGKRRLNVDFKKGYRIMSEVIEEQKQADKKLLYPKMGDLMQLVSFGKACGYIPTGEYESRAKRLMQDDDFFPHLEHKLSPLEEDIIRECTLRSLKEALKGTCDFDDQILMPTCFGGAFPLYKVTMVDEAQDLSALNHAMLRKVCGTRRLIAVGDQCQAIYGFRGAHQDGMALLKRSFKMKELTLTTSFRCAKAVVAEARWRAPRMIAPDWAKEGQVTSFSAWCAADLQEDAAIICRNNAPLFSIAVKLLKDGRPAELDGKDVVQQLTKIMNKFGGSALKQEDLLEKIADWLLSEKARMKPSAHNRLEDQAECMRTFAAQGATLGDALHYANHLVNLHSPLKLMTGHKSKGLEFDHVYFLDEQLIGKEKQEPNIRYVIQTRARDTLTYLTSEGYICNEPDMATE